MKPDVPEFGFRCREGTHRDVSAPLEERKGVFETLGGTIYNLKVPRICRGVYRGASPIRNSAPLGPCSRTMPRALWKP